MRQLAALLLRLCLVVVLFGVFYSYAMFQGGFVSWFLFYSFLPILAYMILLIVYPISGWKVSRKLSSKTIKASEKITVQIQIRRKIPFPVYYCIIEEMLPATLLEKDSKFEKYKHMGEPAVPAERRTIKRMVFPWLGRTINYEYVLDQVPRGEHCFQTVRVRTGDFFGFIKKEHSYQVSDYLLAYPNYRNVVIKEKVTSFEEGATTSHSLKARNTNMVTGVREYLPGDRFAWIDWKATARKNTMMTKEFEQEKSSDLLLILDAGNVSGGHSLLFEGGIELAASLAAVLKKRFSKLAFMSLGTERTFLPFQQNQGEKGLLINYLAKLQPGGNVSFALQLSRELQRIPQGLVTMLITTNLTRELQSPLAQLSRKSKKVILFLIKPSSQITEEDSRMIHQLAVDGIVVNVMTEAQLSRKQFEVNG